MDRLGSREWTQYILRDLCEITSSKRIFASDYLSEGVPFYRGKEITEKFKGELEVSTELFISRAKYEEIKTKFGTPKAGDLLLTSVGTLGSPYVLRHGDEFYFKDGNITWFRNFKNLESRFLYYWLVSREGRAELKKATIGSSQSAYTIVLLKELKINLPPLPTQRRIAAVLSAYDDLIANNQRRIAILEELARSLYREWFVEFRFPGYEGVAIVERDGMRVPEGWGVVRATDALYINPPTKVPRAGLKPFLSMGGLSEISMLVNEEVEYREGNSGSKFKNGDTLFARITPCLENGKTGFVQFLTSDTDVAFGSTEFIVLRSRTLCPEMVYLLARSDVFRDNAIKSMSGATGRQRVQEKCFAQFYLAQPDTETLALFSSEASLLFKAIKTLAEKNANLRRTRDLLLPRLVSGELDVSELEIAGVPEEAA